MKKHTLVWIIVIITLISLGSLIVFSKRSQAPSVVVVSNTNSEQKLSDINVTYTLSQSDQNLYSIKVSSSTQDGQAVLVNAKACNTMNSTITILPKDSQTDKKVVKTLNDGRLVLEPMTMSTLMACEPITAQTDDTALNGVINSLADSLQSF